MMKHLSHCRVCVTEGLWDSKASALHRFHKSRPDKPAAPRAPGPPFQDFSSCEHSASILHATKIIILEVLRGLIPLLPSLVVGCNDAPGAALVDAALHLRIAACVRKVGTTSGHCAFEMHNQKLEPDRRLYASVSCGTCTWIMRRSTFRLPAKVKSSPYIQ